MNKAFAPGFWRFHRYFREVSAGLLALALTSGCGISTDVTDPNLTIEMYGVFESPAGAEGDTIPKWQTYLIEGVTLHLAATDTADAEDVALYTGDPTALKILDRPQIVFEKDLTSHDGKVISGITVSFDPIIVVAGPEKSDHEVTLDTGDLTLTATKTIDKTKGLDLFIKVRWRNTVDTSGTESVTPPTFDLSLD